jgi:poly-gamma-glutamate system protein
LPKARNFRPSMRSSWTLLALTIVSLAMYLWANQSRVVQLSAVHEEKLQAAQWMNAAMDTLRARKYPQVDFLDDINDPNASTLIGQQFSPITTETGDLEAKWTALNPNMAAVMVDYFHSAGLRNGDVIAVGLTGSLPGMNLAMYAAAEAMGIQPVVIASVGASSWGANDPGFTWLDMESILIHADLMDQRSIAASIGGGDDIGRQLSPRGRDLLHQAIERNDLPLLFDENIEEAVDTRMATYDDVFPASNYRLYVNIGGGVVSLGHSKNSELIGEGLTKRLPSVNYPRRGVVHAMNLRGMPILNVVNIASIAEEFYLPLSPNPLPDPGIGRLFSEVRYNLTITFIALLIILLTLIVVLFYDRRAQRLDRPGADPDTLL